MSLNPLNELKRRLDDDVTPLSKRLCLAKNIVLSHHFPTASKERIIAEWLKSLTKENKLNSAELQKVLDWLTVEDLTGELKSRLIQVVSQYVQRNILQNSDVLYIFTFLENPKISSQICQQINDYLTITTTLLQYLKNEEKLNVTFCEKLLNNLLKYYKESKKKLEFIVKFVEGENLETVFSFLETECHDLVVNVCQNVLFPTYKKTFFISYLQTLIRKDNIEELIAEKGDNIQSVLKIMSIFFEFPKHRTEKDAKFLQNFIEVFVSCFQKESQVIFAFFIMVANALIMKQNYIIPSMTMTPITFEENDEKIKRNIFLNMLEIILKNEIDMSVRLTDTLGVKIAKVETKKNFLSFLQEVMMGQLKLKGKIDKVTLQIIKTALKLDPIIIEQKMEEILPPIMTCKKGSNVIESYQDMLNCLLEIVFKLSRGTQFLSQMLPLIKLNLDTCNTDQNKLRKEIKENAETGIDSEKLKSKLIMGTDIFPQECVETYGRLTTELMFRQNKELLEVLLKDFEVYCLLMLEEGIVNPSTITVLEVMSAILSSFLRHNKMADHTVPQNIAEDFWIVYAKFDEEFLMRFGKCVLKLDNDPSLLHSYLKICLAYSQLKLLNIKYSNYKLPSTMKETNSVFDMGVLLTCLSGEEWEIIASKVEGEGIHMLDNLLLFKIMAIELLSIQTGQDNTDALVETKSHLIKNLNSNLNILGTDKYFPRVLFTNLEKTQYKNLAKIIVKLYLNDDQTDIFSDIAILNNRSLLNGLVLEVAKNSMKCLENTDTLYKALGKSEFNMAAFAKETNIKEYFNKITIGDDQDDKIKKCIDAFKMLRIAYLDENYQLTAIFVLLTLKKCCQSKKIRKNIDQVLQNIFELSQHVPDLYQVFPVDFIFSFDDTTLMDLLTLKIKTSNQLLLIKSLIEKAVKRVKADSDLVKNIVELLISKKLEKNNSIETFSDPSFQITCIILPLIVKQKKAITASAFRSILADLQDKLHKTLLETFKNINFTENSSLFKVGITEDSVVDSDSNMAALNAIAAYTLTLSRYCETTDMDENRNLDHLWTGLEFFIQNAIQSISNADSKAHHVESSLQLLNVTLRHIKKLGPHPVFDEKDKVFHQIWSSISSRLAVVFRNKGSVKNCGYLEDMSVTLKFVCELVSIEGFERLVAELGKLVVLKKPIEIIKDDNKDDLTNHLVSKYLWSQCLKSNTVGPKCGAMTKVMFQNCRNLKSWIRQHYDSVHNVASKKKRKLEVYSEEKAVKVVKVNDDICNILRVDLDILTEVIFAGKKISLDYKFLDCIFELQYLIHYILGSNSVHLKCEITWQSFFKLFEGSVAILNSLLVSREELLEDRWPCYMQCYRALTWTLCEKSSSQEQLERGVEEKLAEAAHSIEKLTHAISKRKKQVSRIAAYTVADICKSLEKNAPSRIIRQHLENSVAVLIQASDSTYAMAFLKRALAGSVGQMTMTNLYTMYKRYHKYTGNA